MLGPLERNVVAALQARQEATSREVLEELTGRGLRVAYTTVSTILTRLYAKGVIARRTEDFKGGVRYVYAYKDIEDAYIDSLLGGLITTFGRRGVVHLAQRLEGLNEEDVRRLRGRLEP